MTTEQKTMRRFLKFHPWYAADVDRGDVDNPSFKTNSIEGREALGKFLRWLVCDKRLEAFDDEGSSPLFTLYAKKPVIGVLEAMPGVSFKDEHFEDEEFSE